jgi:predicted metal-binding protein
MEHIEEAGIHSGDSACSLPPYSLPTPIVAEIERQVFLKGFYKAFAMASGPCELCEECNLDGDCRYPYEARPSMEACGIDVFQTAREAGFPIEVLTSCEDTPNFYSLLLVE